MSSLYNEFPIGCKVYVIENRLAEKKWGHRISRGYRYIPAIWPYVVTEHLTEDNVEFCMMKDEAGFYSDFTIENINRTNFRNSSDRLVFKTEQKAEEALRAINNPNPTESTTQ